VDPDNPVVALCAQGMQAESEGRAADALALFLQAWQARSDDYESCIAAHYVARHQRTPEDILRWNQTSLDHATAVGDERVVGFYPSLYLNLGKCHEDLGDPERAMACYDLAAASSDALPPGPYGDMVRGGIAAGRERLATVRRGLHVLTRLERA
jgi:tetratricopeptide (TPR) repeat protein